MPRNKTRKLYDNEHLLKAVAAVKNGMTYKKASEKFGVPASTINDKCLIKYTSGKSKPGTYYNILCLFFNRKYK